MPTAMMEPLRIPEGFWQRADVLTALDARDIGALFRLVRQQTGASQLRIGVAVELGQTEVSRIMRTGRGQQRVTSLEVFTRIADGLNMPNHARTRLGLAPRSDLGMSVPDVNVVTVGDEPGPVDPTPQSGRPGGIRPLDSPHTWHTVTIDTSTDTRLSNHEHEDTDVHRRRLIQDLAVAGLTAPLLGIEQLRHDLLGAIHDEPYDHAEWEAIAWDYGCMYASTPPHALLADLTQDLSVANAQLQRLSDENQRRDLSRVLAQLGVFLAQTMGNLGNIHAGRRWWRFARRMADTSTDPEVRVWVRGRDIIRSLYERQPLQRIIDLADEAVSISRKPGMGTGSVLIGKAQALAVLGRTDEAHGAMRAVYAALDRLPTRVTSDTASMYGWPEYRLRHGESFVYTYLGDTNRAETAQRRALALYAPEMFRERAQVRLHEALRLVRSGDARNGVDHAVQTLSTLPDSQRIEVVLEVARSVARAVPPAEHHHAAVAELYGIAGPALPSIAR